MSHRSDVLIMEQPATLALAQPCPFGRVDVSCCGWLVIPGEGLPHCVQTRYEHGFGTNNCPQVLSLLPANVARGPIAERFT
jgi:hypothetical protein